jgi:RNA exonuclease 1
MDELKAKIKNGALLAYFSRCDRVDYSADLGEFRADFEPILACIARSYSRNRGPNGRRMRTAIVDHGKPGALNSTSATAPTTAVACTHNVEVLDGLKGALDSQDRLYIWSWQMHRSINYN